MNIRCVHAFVCVFVCASVRHLDSLVLNEDVAKIIQVYPTKQTRLTSPIPQYPQSTTPVKCHSMELQCHFCLHTLVRTRLGASGAWRGDICTKPPLRLLQLSRGHYNWSYLKQGFNSLPEHNFRRKAGEHGTHRWVV